LLALQLDIKRVLSYFMTQSIKLDFFLNIVYNVYKRR